MYNYVYNIYYTNKYELKVIGVGTSSKDLTSSRYPLPPVSSPISFIIPMFMEVCLNSVLQINWCTLFWELIHFYWIQRQSSKQHQFILAFFQKLYFNVLQLHDIYVYNCFKITWLLSNLWNDRNVLDYKYDTGKS